MTTTSTTPTDRGDWISTASGLPFWPCHPRPVDVRIGDIAHALSHLCRFAGHTKAFYSVAQHSLLVSILCEPQDALWGLLHDASEAYVCDLPRPLKHTEALRAYRDLEDGVQAAVCEKFGLAASMPASVKAADSTLLRTEQRDLMTMPEGWVSPTAAVWPSQRLVPMAPAEAKQRFLARFEELMRRRGA